MTSRFKKTSQILALVWTALVATAPALAADDPLYAGDEPWRRLPELVVPHLPKAPTINGVVDRAEWLAASELGPMKVGMEGVADEFNRRVFLGYDQKQFYIAVQLQRPSGALAPERPVDSGRVDSTYRGDLVELMIAPALNFDEAYSLWVYGNGAYGDALLNRRKDTRWNPDWQQAARVTETGWELEVAIPFAAFGLQGPPSPQQAWGLDVIDNRATPSGLLAHWSYRGNYWPKYENFGRIRFDRVPAVRYTHAGEIGDRKLGVEIAVANATDTGAQVSTHLKLLRRKAGEDAGPKSYFDNIESGVAHDDQVEFTKGVTLEEMIDFARGFYEPVPGGEVTQLLRVPAGQQRAAHLVASSAVGEYLVEYQVMHGDRALAAGTSVFRVQAPLALKLEPYWLYAQVIDVEADLQKVAVPRDARAVFTLAPAEQGHEPLVTETVPVTPGAETVRGTLAIGDLAPGFYQVEVTILAPSGEEIARNREAVRRPEDPAWFNSEAGDRIAVPEPWTPIEAGSNGQVALWGRSYDLSTVLPAAAISQGQAVLATPARLDLQIGGRPVELAPRRVELQEMTDGKAIYAVELAGGGLRIAGTMTVEFDGLIWYDLEATAATDAVVVDHMTLALDVNPQLAELMGRHKFLTDDLIMAKPAPAKNGGPGLLQHAQIPFTPYLWIGNEQAGMGFVAEAPIDWEIADPGRVLETLPAVDGNPAGLRAHLVQAPRPVSAEQPMRLQFGLQSTPIRPIPDRHEILNIYQKLGVWGDDQRFKELADLGCKVVVFYYAWRGDPKTEMGGTPEHPDDPAQRKKLKAAVEAAHRHGLKVIMFTGWGINAQSPAWKQFGLELGASPVTNKGWGTYKQSAGPRGGYADFMAHGHAMLAREYGVDGVLWDSTANITPDQNLRIGTAWIDQQGRVRPKFAVLATRELYRRVYNVYHGEVRDNGVIYNHAGSMWPVNVFADITNRGEGRPMVAKSLRDSWVPFEEFRAEYSAEPFGTLYSGEINDWKKLPMRVSTHTAVTLLHGTYAKEMYSIQPDMWDYDYEGRPIMALWGAFDWLGWDQSTQKHFYYQNAAGPYQAVAATPKSLLSSAFVSGDGRRALVVVSNLDQKPVPNARVIIDRDVLGLRESGPLKIEDAILGTAVAHDQGRLTIDIDQQRYRILKVWLP